MNAARPLAAVLTAAFTGVQVGAAIVASRAAVGDLGPTVLALFRYMIGAAIILPIAVHLGWLRIPLRDLWVIAALGIGQFGILVALLNLVDRIQHLVPTPDGGDDFVGIGCPVEGLRI